MRIDGVSISHRGKDRAYALLAELTKSQLHRRDVDSEEIIQAMAGPECFELHPSCMRFSQEEVIVVHDTNQEGALYFKDKKFGPMHIACRPLYQAAEAIRPDTYLFEDHNNPGMVFKGTREDFERMQDDGYAPHVFYGPHSPDMTRAVVDYGDGDTWVDIIDLTEE